MLVAHACNLTYSGGRDQEDHGSKPGQANVSETLSQNNNNNNNNKNPSQKRAGGVTQM
jgi:hypothetical protein